MKKNNSVHQMVTMAMLAAISIVLMYFVRFPILPAAPFLEYDMADVPILIGTFLFGPVQGLVLTIIVSLIQGFTVSAGSGWIGIVMHIFATGAFVIIAGNVYKVKPTRLSAFIGLVVGSIGMTLVMIPLNLIFTVRFLGVPREAVMAMLIPTIIPFNLIKAGLNSIVTFVVYKSVSKTVARLAPAETKDVPTVEHTNM